MSLPAARVGAAARYGALFALSVATYVIDSVPWSAIQHAAWIIPIRLASIGTPAVFWQWAAAHFDDEFVPVWRRWLVWLGLVGLGAVAIVTDRAMVRHVVQSATLVLAGLGLWHVLSGRRLDLIEGRRRLPVYLAIGAALYIAAINLCFLLPSWLQLWWRGSTVNAGGLAAISFAFAVLRLRSERDELATVVARTAPATPGVMAHPLSTPAVAGSEALWLAALRAAMDRDKVYRGEGFTIAALAARLGIPEYRLRRLINQRLGHRFSRLGGTRPRLVVARDWPRGGRRCSVRLSRRGGGRGALRPQLGSARHPVIVHRGRGGRRVGPHPSLGDRAGSASAPLMGLRPRAAANRMGSWTGCCGICGSSRFRRLSRPRSAA
jgi:hypothetical protein